MGNNNLFKKGKLRWNKFRWLKGEEKAQHPSNTHGRSILQKVIEFVVNLKPAMGTERMPAFGLQHPGGGCGGCKTFRTPKTHTPTGHNPPPTPPLVFLFFFWTLVNRGSPVLFLGRTSQKGALNFGKVNKPPLQCPHILVGRRRVMGLTLVCRKGRGV